MTTRLQRIKALREALVLLVVIASAIAAMVWISQRPSGPDEVRLSVSTLRAQVAGAGAQRERIEPLATSVALGNGPVPGCTRATECRELVPARIPPE